MSVVFQQATGTTGVAANTLTCAITPNVNNSLIFVVIHAQNSAGRTLSSIADNVNGNYTLLANSNDASKFTDTYVYWVANTTTAALTITVTWSNSVSMAMSVGEVSGQASSTPIGNQSQKNLTTGSSVDIITSANVAGSIGDMLVVAAGNYYTPTWTNAAQVPSPSPTIPTGATQNKGIGNGNSTFAYSILSSNYNNTLGLNPGTTDDGDVIGFQIKAASGVAAFYNDAWGQHFPQQFNPKHEVIPY
jgi:hypothetical protein